MDELLQNILEKKAQYRLEDLPTIEAWEEKAKEILLKEGIAGSDAVKYLVDSMNSDIEKMNSILLTAPSHVLPDTQRDRMIDKKELYEKIVSYFDIKGEREELEKIVNDN